MFTRENTKEIKGIAIIYMLIHHMYRFPMQVPFGMSLATGFKISEMEFTMLLGTIGQACASIFMFLGGYGLYKAFQRNGRGAVTSRIISLYKNFWGVFFVVVPIGFLFFSKQEQYCEAAERCFRFSVFSGKDFIASALGWSCAYNSEWWFFKEYLFALLAGAIFISAFRKCDKVYLEIFAVIAIQVLVSLVFPNTQEILGVQELASNAWLSNLFCMNAATPLFFAGVVCSKYNIFESWKHFLEGYRKWWVIALGLIGIMLCAYSRAFIERDLDLVLIPVYVFFMWVVISQIPLLGKCLRKIGNHSTSMWLLHTFFIYYFGSVAKLIYGIGNWLIAFMVFFGITFAASVLLDNLWNWLGKKMDCLRKGECAHAEG